MLKGKTALITGASRGIGRAIALGLAEAGADVAVNYAGNTSKAEETKALAETYGVKCRVYRADVASFSETKAMTEAVLKDFGRVDILVNNAGITRDKLVPMLTEEDFDAVINANLKGAFHMIKHLYGNFLKNRSGAIVNISSVAGLMGNAGQANYAAAKAGMIGLTKSVARELAGRGVTCNAIAPGFIESDMTAALGAEIKKKCIETIPMKKFGRPEDVAALAVFLAGAPYITGTVIKVDGGLYI